MTKRTRGLLAVFFCFILAGCAADQEYGTLELLREADETLSQQSSETTMTAPPFTATDSSGESIESAELFEGRYTVLFATNSWCEYCQEEADKLQSAISEQADDVSFVTLVLDESEDDFNDYLKTTEPEHVVLWEPTGDFTKRYAVFEPPVVVILAPDGGLYRQWYGQQDHERFFQALEELRG